MDALFLEARIREFADKWGFRPSIHPYGEEVFLKDPDGDMVAIATVRKDFQLKVQITPYMVRVLGSTAQSVIRTINGSGSSGTLEHELAELNAIPGVHLVIPADNGYRILDPDRQEMGFIECREHKCFKEYMTPYMIRSRAQGNGHEARPLAGQELGQGNGLGRIVDNRYKEFLERVKQREQPPAAAQVVRR